MSPTNSRLPASRRSSSRPAKASNAKQVAAKQAVAKQGEIKPRKAVARQQERTDATIELLVRSATRLFGERGYANTSLEDIALDCGLTIGAIYHHFGNKKTLFAAVNEAAEQRIIDAAKAVDEGDVLQLFQQRWKGLLNLCNEAGFRQIVLIDSPNVLGRDRWVTSEVSKTMPELALGSARRTAELELALRIMRGAAAEAILAVAEANNTAATRRIVDGIINRLLSVIVGDFVDEPSA